MTMLVVDHLAKTYGDAATGVEAIREISFDVREREFVCIVGPSGGGKTTLLRALCGLHPKSGGSIQLHGREVVEPPPEMAAPSAKTGLERLQKGPAARRRPKEQPARRSRTSSRLSRAPTKQMGPILPLLSHANGGL